MSYQDFGYQVNLLDGGTIANTATNPNDIVNLQTAQAILSGEANIKDYALVATIADVDLATGGLLVIDGYQTLEGDRILVRSQTNPVENGIYTASAGSWARSTDADEDGEIVTGTQIFVSDSGHDHAHIYVMNTTGDIVIGTDAQTWVIKQAVTGHAQDLGVDDANFTVMSGTNAQTALDSADDALQAQSDRLDNLSGVAGSDLGTFTGSTIADNTDVKTALQTLETKAEADAQIYANNGAELTTQTNTAGTWTTFTHGLNENRLSSVSFFDEGNNMQTLNGAVLWRPKSGDANAIEVYASQVKTMTIVFRA